MDGYRNAHGGRDCVSYYLFGIGVFKLDCMNDQAGPKYFMTPKRIQRKRTKGWRTPANTVYVGRPTKWGNPFVVGHFVPDAWYNLFDALDHNYYFQLSKKIGTVQEAVGLYFKYVVPRLHRFKIYELRGKNLSCWCPIGRPCHADILLKIANQ